MSNENTSQTETFAELMEEYPSYKSHVTDLGLMSANGISFSFETKNIENKSQQDIAKEKAFFQLQAQGIMIGCDLILGLRTEFTTCDVGVCICTASGTAVKYIKKMPPKYKKD
eukprot:234978_1